MSRTHASGPFDRRRKQSRWLCRRDRFGYTSTTYSDCKHCARRLEAAGYIRLMFGWVYQGSAGDRRPLEITSKVPGTVAYLSPCKVRHV